MSATDLDAGNNALLTYSLQPDVTAFRIDSDTGKVYVNSALDRERVPFYELNVMVADPGNCLLH